MRRLQAGPPESGHEVSALGISPDARTLAVNVVHEGVFRFDLSAAGAPHHPMPQENRIFNRNFLFSPDGRVSWTNTNGRWTHDPVSDRVHATPMGTGGAINTQLPLAGGRLLTGHGFERMGVGLWQEGRGWDWDNLWFFDYDGSFHGLAAGFHADRFYFLHGDGPADPNPPQLAAHAFADRAVIDRVAFPYRGARRLVSSPDGSVAVAAHDQTLAVWRPGAKVEKVRPCGRKHITDVAFHPSGALLAVACNDNSVRFVDAATWRVARQFTWDVGKVKAVAFSPDGTLAAAGGESGKTVVWDTE